MEDKDKLTKEYEAFIIKYGFVEFEEWLFLRKEFKL